MHLRSLSLRNYRVYRAADIEFPDGLVGVYGPNGAGKSALIESVRYALYGDARTEKSELRSAGINEDVRVELVFEHEGNSYEVRRVLKGRNLTPSVEVYVNRRLAVQSVREANAYLARVLGMDQRAFLASVCAQQKELTTFATMVPSERRRLVLDLLGVSPIERALTRVREEARDARTAAGAARAQLSDLPHAEALAAAKRSHVRAAAERDAAVQAGRKLAAQRDEQRRVLERARAAEQRAAKAAALVESAEQAIKVAGDEVTTRQSELERLPDPGFDAEAHRLARRAAEALPQVVLALSELRGRADRGEVERKLAREALDRAGEADQRGAALQAQATALGEAGQALAAARERVRQAAAAARRTHGEHERAAEALAAAGRRHADLEQALATARARHEEVAGLEERAAYLARLADLMAAFRLHLVARLGRRLSVEAAGLFAELTDHEYQDMVVDPEDYSIRIADDGTEHELARFSGSENDLASLSLRVAVSLVIAEGAGELGLLVLDEVLGALDRERRGRMLAALTTLQGRFRQVLLVTHNDEVKDLLPAAIEVHKGPHRTSTVAVLS